MLMTAGLNRSSNCRLHANHVTMTLVALLPLELILILRGVWSIDKVRFRRSRAPAPRVAMMDA